MKPPSFDPFVVFLAKDEGKYRRLVRDLDVQLLTYGAPEPYVQFEVDGTDKKEAVQRIRGTQLKSAKKAQLLSIYEQTVSRGEDGGLAKYAALAAGATDGEVSSAGRQGMAVIHAAEKVRLEERVREARVRLQTLKEEATGRGLHMHNDIRPYLSTAERALGHDTPREQDVLTAEIQLGAASRALLARKQRRRR